MPELRKINNNDTAKYDKRQINEWKAGTEATALSEVEGEDDDAQIRAAERRWPYLQRSPLRGLEILLILKTPVGQDWLRRIFDDTRVRFSRDGNAFTVGTTFSLSPEPNTKEHSPRWNEAVCAFWEKYEPTWLVKGNHAGQDSGDFGVPLIHSVMNIRKEEAFIHVENN